MDSKPVEKSSVAKMIDDLHQRFIRSQGDNGTFPKMESVIMTDKRHAKEADDVDPVVTSSDAVKGLANGGEVRNPNEKKGMKEEAGNYAPGGEVPDPMSSMGDMSQGQPSQTPSLGDTSAAINAAPDTNYDFYGNTGSDQRAALYKQLLDQQRSPGNLIAQGLGGIGDAFSAAGGKSTDFQDKARGISTENTANRIGAMDTQRTQKLTDMQGNQEMIMNDPKHPMAQALRASLKGMGVNVPSGMSTAILLKALLPMGQLADRQATLGVQQQVANQNQTNQVAGRHMEAAKGLEARPWYQKAAEMIPGVKSDATKALQGELSGGQTAPLTATNSVGHKITSDDGGKTWK